MSKQWPKDPDQSWQEWRSDLPWNTTDDETGWKTWWNRQVQPFGSGELRAKGRRGGPLQKGKAKEKAQRKSNRKSKRKSKRKAQMPPCKRVPHIKAALQQPQERAALQLLQERAALQQPQEEAASLRKGQPQERAALQPLTKAGSHSQKIPCKRVTQLVEQMTSHSQQVPCKRVAQLLQALAACFLNGLLCPRVNFRHQPLQSSFHSG